GGHVLMDRRITPGGLVAFMAYMEILAGPVSRAGNYYHHVQTCRAVGGRLRRLLEERQPRPVSGSRRASGSQWDISVQDLSFRHPGATRDALRDVSFGVKPGETLALVGRNGAGKSTLLDLLMRLYDPTTGRVVIGGVDLVEWDLEAWRAAVGVLPQEAFLFHATVAENIAYGRPGASRTDVLRAAEATGVDRFLRPLTRGLDTVVGERGAKLSGGERQLIALARLFLRSPP